MTLILSGSDGLSDVDGTAAAPALRGTDTNTGIFFPAADTIAFATGGTEDARFNSAGNLQTIGTISVGNATPSTSGAGITFPATQSASSDANTLDDYEEGTFTPFYTPSSGAFTTLTYSAQTGKYTKIGNIVYFAINIFTSVVTLGTASGNLRIGGLPFTPDATSQFEPGAALGRVYRWASAIPNIRCNINGGATTVSLPNMATNSTSGTEVQASDLTTGSNSFYNCVDISGCYKIA
jgi:hypothetical protein